MPKHSGPTNRNVVNHQAGKGDASRITDVQAYRRNFDEIDWKYVGEICDKARKILGESEWMPTQRILDKRLRTLREIEAEEHAWRMGL